jgi:hypothetical protein
MASYATTTLPTFSYFRMQLPCTPSVPPSQPLPPPPHTLAHPIHLPYNPPPRPHPTPLSPYSLAGVVPSTHATAVQPSEAAHPRGRQGACTARALYVHGHPGAVAHTTRVHSAAGAASPRPVHATALWAAPPRPHVHGAQAARAHHVHNACGGQPWARESQ